MNKFIIAIVFSSLSISLSNQVTANDFFSNLKESEVQQIFDRADNSKDSLYLINNSKNLIPAVQILPKVSNPKTVIPAAAQCIKLYNCNQNICLVGLNTKKYATSETILNQFTQPQEKSDYCDTYVQSTKKAPALPTTKPKQNTATLWTKVIKVKSNDSLNVRKSTNYKSKKMGTLAYNANCVKRLSCKGKWCKIESGSLAGWVHKSYLKQLEPNEAQQCQ